jgi:acetylornithine deacetylase/succinyl-diaminopimelate desuccinylase-like protein
VGSGGSTSSAGGTTGAGGSSGGSGGSSPVDSGAPPVDAGPGKPGLDGEISGAIGSVSSTRIGSAITTLAGFTTRNTCSNGAAMGNTIGAARDWIKAQFQAAGFTPALDNFSFSGCAGGMVTDQNVIAVKLGAHPDRVIVVGGHYDSRTLSGTDPTSPAPGANDSGSQTAAVIEIARALAHMQFDATILFAAFAGEEQGLYGSAQLAKDYAMYVTPNAKVEVMLNLDIVGGDNVANTAMTLQQFRLFSPGTPREFNQPMGVTDDTSPARGVMRYVGYWGSAYVPSMTMLSVLREDRMGRGGDQESFNNVGIPAVRFIETVESPNAATVQSHQHSPNDLPMYVTPAYTARIAQVVTAVAASLARAPTPPQMGVATGSGAGPWTLSWSAPASGPAVDHYVIAARPTTENLYHARVAVPAATTMHAVTAADLGLAPGAAIFISVAAVDAAGHESLFAYPEYRCDATSCAVQPGSLDVTARN